MVEISRTWFDASPGKKLQDCISTKKLSMVVHAYDLDLRWPQAKTGDII
jgi:hypothetical protein